MALASAICVLACLILPTRGVAQAPASGAVLPRIIVQTGHAAEISVAAWTADGRFLLTGSTDRQILVWDLQGRIVNRIALQDTNRRSVVEAIRLLPDNRSAEIDVIWFRDMFDNGVGSEVWRERYMISFADGQAREIEREQVQTDWTARIDFLAQSLKLKQSLIDRRDWPRSSLGWTLGRKGAGLTMVPPEPGARPISLTGPLGSDLDGGDARLEAAARRIEARAFEIDAAASGMKSKGGPKDAEPADEIAAYAPRFSPGGSMLAWLDRGTTTMLSVLDLERGSLRARVDLGSGPAARPLGWTGPTTLATGLGGGRTIAIDRTAIVSQGSSADCFLNTSGEVGNVCAPAAGPTVPTDARNRVSFSKDERNIVHVADAATGRYLCSAFLDETEVRGGAYIRASADHRWLTVQSALGYTEVFALTDQLLQSARDCAPGEDCTKPPTGGAAVRGRQCPSWARFQTVPGRIGFHPTRPLLWIEGRQGSIAFFNLASIGQGNEAAALGLPLFTLYRLPDGRFFAIDSKGRYDTNLPPDTEAVRWNVSDAPLQSLAAQTFMRDYYQPGLMRRLMQCAESGTATCDDRFPPIRPVASINRVLPLVEIASVEPGAEPYQAVVRLKITNGVDLSAANGKTRSGLYDIRLFHNNRIVFSWPNQVEADVRQRRTGSAEPEPRPDWVGEAMRADIETWRRLSLITPEGPDESQTFTFTIVVPPGDAGRDSVFSAYVFNEDRVKSDTARKVWRMPPVPPRRPRAFIITVGIDAYDSPHLALQFAADDAALMSKRLAEIPPEYEIRRISLEGRKAADGRIRRVTRSILHRLFNAMMGTGTAEDARSSARVRNSVIEDLEAEGFEVAQLDALRPDDIVILSFSGHGWADKQGNFYLLPADADWPKGSDQPKTETLISAASLASYLYHWKAREIVLIIDACHSAASVAGGDFKPGPMGDAGLGQLAYDKGIRILAATQADDVALEDPTLRQGLLTYALATEGISAAGGKADADSDGRITLEEWLSYATWRMPTLGSDVRLGRLKTDATGSRGWVRANAGTSKPAVQEPSLFDFNAAPSGIVLREGVRP